jgi:hypothetical protein
VVKVLGPSRDASEVGVGVGVGGGGGSLISSTNSLVSSTSSSQQQQLNTLNNTLSSPSVSPSNRANKPTKGEEKMSVCVYALKPS